MSIASELQDKIDAKAAIKASIEAKGVTVGDVKLNQYASKVDAIAQDPSIPVGAGQHLVTFYDFDGKVLKRQRVNTGENATAPAIPTHQYLTFAEWNNPFTNVQSDIDTGAIYNTTDGKTYLFITLTPVTGLAPTLYFSKSSTSLMTIDWGDGTTSTSTTSGNQNVNHVYATAGDYIITVDNSAGGIWTMGYGGVELQLFVGYQKILTKILYGANTTTNTQSFQANVSIKYISIGTNLINIGYACHAYNYSLKHINIPNGGAMTFTILGNHFQYCYSLLKFIPSSSKLSDIGNGLLSVCYSIVKIIFQNNLTNIGQTAFAGLYGLTEIIFLSTTPPTLANINAFTGINPICKIYVPDASVNAYKTATNWVTYANYIYPLSQKPQSDE